MSKYVYLEVFQSLGIRDNESQLYFWNNIHHRMLHEQVCQHKMENKQYQSQI